MLNKRTICETLICIFMLTLFLGTAAARETDEYTLFSSLSVKQIQKIDNNLAKREKIHILLNFTLGYGNNGIVPSEEDITIELDTAEIAGAHKQRFKIFIPARSFVKENLWYEIYEPLKPSKSGIKVYSNDNTTVNVSEDITDTLLYFDAIFTSKDEKSHYLFIEAKFEQEDMNVLIPASLDSSKKLRLTIGDDVGTTLW